MNIIIENSTNENINNDLIKAVISAALEYENIKNDCEVSVTIADNEIIRQLNKKYRNIDRPTDVLSFPLIDFRREKLPPPDKILYLGDIVISIEKAREQAVEYGHSLQRELGFLTAHSMLHLLGYDHMIKDEEIIMFKKQEEILNLLGLER